MYKIKYSQELISATIDRLASNLVINQNTVFLVLMNGGAWFAHELISRLGSTPVRIEYAKLSSYNGQQQGQIKEIYMPQIDWADKEVIVLDDICDSGSTLKYVYDTLQPHQPKSINFITLLSRKGHYQLSEYIHLTSGIEDESGDFFVGCGLDDNGIARNLPFVGVC